MILIKGKCRLTKMQVVIHDHRHDPYFQGKGMFANLRQKTPNDPLLCHFKAGTFPPGVVPVAYHAKAEGLDKHISAVGFATTDCEAQKQAKRKLRLKVMEHAKATKHVFRVGADGCYVEILGKGGDRMYGRGATLALALADYNANLNSIEEMLRQVSQGDQEDRLHRARRQRAWDQMKAGQISYDQYREWEKNGFEATKKPQAKWRWWNWFYNPHDAQLPN